MKFKIRVGNAGSKDTWWEEYERDGDNAQAEADAIMSRWNDHLQQGEKPRTLHEVVVIDAEKSPSNHKWRKTNSFTVVSKRGQAVWHQC